MDLVSRCSICLLDINIFPRLQFFWINSDVLYMHVGSINIRIYRNIGHRFLICVSTYMTTQSIHQNDIIIFANSCQVIIIAIVEFHIILTRCNADVVLIQLVVHLKHHKIKQWLFLVFKALSPSPHCHHWVIICILPKLWNGSMSVAHSSPASASITAAASSS